MPRKKYAHITHLIPRLSEWDYWPSSLRAQGYRNPITGTTIKRWQRQTQIGTKVRTHPNLLFFPVNAGFNDPLTILCVVDLILRSETDTYIEAHNFSERLQNLYGHLVMFDAITVGRVLSALTQEHQNMPRPEGAEAIAYINIGGARHYAIMESVQGWAWLGFVRDMLGDECLNRLHRARIGDRASRSEAIWDKIGEIPWIGPA